MKLLSFVLVSINFNGPPNGSMWGPFRGQSSKFDTDLTVTEEKRSCECSLNKSGSVMISKNSPVVCYLLSVSFWGNFNATVSQLIE